MLDVNDPISPTAYAYMKKNALETPNLIDNLAGKGRRAIASYLQYGYIPLENIVREAPHKNEQVSRTLEYAYDDYVLAQVVALFNQTKDVGVGDTDFDTFMEHSEWYRNVVDSDGVGFVRGRHGNGSWYGEDANFDPTVQYNWLTEANVWQYTW